MTMYSFSVEKQTGEFPTFNRVCINTYKNSKSTVCKLIIDVSRKLVENEMNQVLIYFMFS
jgi:hypothetical protein